MSVDAKSIYDVPLLLESEKLDQVVLRKLNLTNSKVDLKQWKSLVDTIHMPNKPNVKIGIVGKYTSLSDSYISVVEAVKHSSITHKCHPEIIWIDSELLNDDTVDDYLGGLDGILIPGGFGGRGVDGKILAAKFARINNVPLLGLCLGMHIVCIEFARNVLSLDGANSSEFDEETKYPVIHILESQKNLNNKGGTMRLGQYDCVIKKNTKLSEVYNKDSVFERHRHRYEFNTTYRKQFEDSGMIFSGVSPDEVLMEVVEYVNNDFFVACQFHPEFKSRLRQSHPLFDGFISSILIQKGILSGTTSNQVLS